MIFIIGAKKDYEERLDKVRELLEEKGEVAMYIDYEFEEDDPRLNIPISKEADIAYNSLGQLVWSDKVYYMRGWRNEPICNFLNMYAKMAGIPFVSEVSYGRSCPKTFTTEDDYVMTKTHTPEFVRDVVELYNSGLSTVAIARKYGMHQKTIWRIVDRNRHKITRDDL